MSTLKSYLCGTWQDGDGEARSLHDPTTGAEVGQVRSMGSLADAVAWARDKGGASLRALSFGQRGELLAAMAKAIYAAREELIDIAVRTSGCTRGDAKFDIDGATAVLSAYAAEAEKLAEQCGEAAWIVADDAEAIFRNSKIRGQHVWLARHGLAVHINAFNFPAWGTMEKAAAALLAGMPVLSKPATSTSLLAHRMTEVVVEAGILPEGCLLYTSDAADE